MMGLTLNGFYTLGYYKYFFIKPNVKEPVHDYEYAVFLGDETTPHRTSMIEHEAITWKKETEEMVKESHGNLRIHIMRRKIQPWEE